MRHPLVLGLIAAVLVLAMASQAAAVTTVQPRLTHIRKTSQWGKPSPDPTGLTYRPRSNTIFVVDSEVEETRRWAGVNFWEMTRAGVVVRQGSTRKFSEEPTDVAYSIRKKRFFVSDDDKDKIFVIALGGDHRLGTPDDRVRSFSTSAFGSHDAEGVAFGAGTLWIADGDGQRVFRMKPGPNGVFNGVGGRGDDIVRHFSTEPLGLQDPEDVEYNGANRRLIIVSRFDKTVAVASTAGALRRVYDLSDTSILRPAGITLAPGTAGSRKALFIADRGYDNDLHPHENDGRIFEFKRTA